MRFPSRSTWLLSGLLGCSGALPGPGQPGALDADGDGWATSDGDCDDADPGSFPLALDLPLDGVDQDCDGQDALALDARALAPGDLVLTELMPDPLAVGADFGEWFELANALDVPVDLEGLLVHDDDRDDFLVDRSVVVEAGGRVVLGASDDPARNGGVPVAFSYEGDFGLSNAADAVVLSIGGLTIDRVTWGPGWPLVEGVALSLDPGADATTNDGPEAWCEATSVYGIAGLGSPGATNPPCPSPFTGLGALDLQPGDLVITEVMQNPLAADGDLGEWLEVLNASGSDVDLSGLSLHDDQGDRFDLPRFVVAAGERVVLGSFVDPGVNGGVPVDLQWAWDFGLANSGQAVVLSVGTREIDRLEYDNGLTFPDPEGASMSLDPDSSSAEDNDDGERWCEASTPMSNGDRGTPGDPNPPCP